MYSLPITTYSNYWRRIKFWSVYLGSLAILVASTRYSPLEHLDIKKTMKPPFQSVNSLFLKSMSTDELKKEALIRGVSSRGLARQELIKQGQISRGVTSPSHDEKEEPSSEAEYGMLIPLVELGVSQLDKLETRLTSKIEIMDKEISFDTQYIESDKIPPGTSQIQAKGEKGIRREVVKTFEIDGQTVDQQVQSFFELKSPKKEVIIRNNKPVPNKKAISQNSNSEAVKVNADLSKLNISKTLSVESTAYTYTGNNTTTGVKPREGMIAVDPNVIAMGTKVYVEGYGYAIAADTGGNIRGNRIDVFFSTLRQCIDWGRRPVLIHVLNPT